VAGDRLPFGDVFRDDKDLNGHLRVLVERLVRMGITLRETQSEIERLYIERTLSACEGNRSRAAKRLGMHRNTLNSKVEQYGLNGEKGP
jgi:DNA-binding NtrC family response regulator